MVINWLDIREVLQVVVGATDFAVPAPNRVWHSENRKKFVFHWFPFDAETAMTIQSKYSAIGGMLHNLIFFAKGMFATRVHFRDLLREKHLADRFDRDHEFRAEPWAWSTHD